MRSKLHCQQSKATMGVDVLIGTVFFIIGDVLAKVPVCVSRNDQIDLTCSVDNHNSTITWLGPNNDVYAVGPETKKSFIEVHDRNRGSQKYSTLRVKNVSAESVGTYKCWVENVQKTYYTVILRDIPVVNLTATPSRIVHEGSFLVLHCQYHCKDSKDILQWRKDGQTMFKNQTKLTFQYIKRTDAGEYQCNLIRSNNNVSSSITIVVKYDPYSMTRMYEIAGGVGASVVVIALAVTIVIIVKRRTKDNLTNKDKITAVTTELPVPTERIRPGINIGDNYSLVKDIGAKMKLLKERLEVHAQNASEEVVNQYDEVDLNYRTTTGSMTSQQMGEHNAIGFQIPTTASEYATDIPDKRIEPSMCPSEIDGIFKRQISTNSSESSYLNPSRPYTELTQIEQRPHSHHEYEMVATDISDKRIEPSMCLSEIDRIFKRQISTTSTNSSESSYLNPSRPYTELTQIEQRPHSHHEYEMVARPEVKTNCLK